MATNGVAVASGSDGYGVFLLEHGMDFVAPKKKELLLLLL